MPSQVHYLCQTYNWKKSGSKSPLKLQAVEMVEAQSEADAIRRAERIHEKKNHAGVDAYKIVVDEEAGDYGEPVFFVRLGEVPDYDN